MTVSHGMDIARVREIGVELQRLAVRTRDLHAEGTAMAQTLEGSWSGPDLEGFLADWEQTGPSLEAAASGLQAAATAIRRDADEQQRASEDPGDGQKKPRPPHPDGEKPHHLPPRKESLWDKIKEAGEDLLEAGEEVLDGVGDAIGEGQDWIVDGLDWLNERWKEFAETDVMETIIGLLEDIGEWFDELPWWGKAIIGAVLAIAAIVAIVVYGLPVLAVLGVAATIYGALELMDDFAELLRDPKGYLTEWWEDSSLFEKVVVIGSLLLTPVGGRILGPIIRRIEGPIEDAVDWIRKKLGIDDPTPSGKRDGSAASGKGDGDEVRLADGSTRTTTYSRDQIDATASSRRLDALLAKHGMTRAEFDAALMEPVPDDPADLSPDQRTLRDIRTEMGAPKQGEPMQKVIAPGDAEKYISGKYPAPQGSATRLEDAASMGTPRELHDGLRLDYEGSPSTRIWTKCRSSDSLLTRTPRYRATPAWTARQGQIISPTHTREMASRSRPIRWFLSQSPGQMRNCRMAPRSGP